MPASANIYQSDYTGPQMDARFAAVAALQDAMADLEAVVAAKYSKPSSGIPETDLDESVQATLALALTAVQSLSDYYTKAQVDDITAAIAASVNSTSGVVVTTLPTAAAGTLGKIYYVGPDASGFYDRYVTSYDGSSYSWLALGNTEVDMTQYATVEQLDELISPELTTANRRITSSGVAAPSTANQNLIVTMFPVIGGKTYYVSGRNYGDDTYLCGFLDSSKTFIANSGNFPNASYTGPQENLEVTAPSNAAYIVVAGDLRAANANTPSVAVRGTLNDAISAIAGQMEVLRGWVTGKSLKTNQGVGNVCPKTAETYASHRYAVITIEPGVKYVVNGTGTSTYHLWAFLNAADIILSSSGSTTASGNTLVLTPPANATQLILNGLNADEGSYILRGDDYGFMKRSELVNNLNGGENAPLAAEQGKVLSDKIAADEVKHNSEVLSQIVSYTMNFVAGTNHSSASDQMKINIPAGTTFLAKFTMGTAAFSSTRSLYAFYADGTNESIGAMTRGTMYQKVAKKDIIAFGNYSAGSDITTSGTMGLEIWSNDGRDGLSIVAVNDIKRVQQGIIAIHKAAANGNGVSLLHFSDIHGQDTELARIVRIKNMFADYIEDAICTGDMLYDTFSDSFAFWDNSGAQDVLPVLGNHDVWISSSGAASETAANCYDKFFGNIADWDVTSPGTGLCYYYKDYANVRLIVLDCMHMDAAQLAWITETLASAKVSNLAVVIASHYTPSTMANMTFNRDTTFTAYGADYTHTTFDSVVPVELLVKDFIDGGGKFACWLCGHYHTDIFGFSEHGQPIICIDKACVTLTNKFYSRVAGTRTQDLFNIISIDADAQVIRVFRIGCTLDYMMRPVETFAYNYGTQEAIYNC